MRGGYRPGSGPVKGTKYRPRAKKSEPKAPAKPKKARGSMAVASNPEDPTKPKDGKPGEKILPLDYMLQVINDPDESDKARKDRMAIAAAPYCHPRKGEGVGKKEEKAERAAKAGQGRFSPSAPPKLKVVGNDK